MNTKPRAKKFRIRRTSEGLAPAPTSPDVPVAPAAPEGAASSPPQTAPAPQPRPSVALADPNALTQRQLRIVRRLAQRHGIEATSETEMLEQLRAAGLDPFDKSKPLALVARVNKETAPGPQDTKPQPQTSAAPQPATAAPASKPVNPQQVTALPQTVPEPATRNLPAKPLPEDLRAREIMRMQRDIARRRKRNMIALGARLAAFVMIPTLLASIYYSFVATPMYATHSEFVIQQAGGGSAGAGGGLGGLLANSSIANSQDSITVQRYLQSREAMLRLNDEQAFRAHFEAPRIDRLQRLSPEATNEEAFQVYSKRVKIAYDPTEGLIRMEVSAADPQVGVAFSQALIAYAEERVDALTGPIREDQMQGAADSFADAEAKMLAAQERVLDLQEARGVLSAEAEVSSLMSQISTFEIEIKQEQLNLQSLLDNARPNATKVEVAERNIQRLETLVADMRAQMTEGRADGASLARITGELVIAEAELETRQMLLAQSLQQLETARIESNSQVRYLLLGVSPTAADAPSYPRAFENTLLAFLVFSGLYLMISLTASILREQVSS